MKINVYKNQKEIAKTYEVAEYDLMYGTIQDILEVLDDGLEDMKDQNQLLQLVAKNRSKLEDLVLDVFSSEGMTKEDLRNVKLKELVPVLIDLFRYVQFSFNSKN